MDKYNLVKLNEIHFVDGGTCGEIYKQNGTKYYSIRCSITSENGSNYHKLKDVRLLITENELNRLINESFYYDKDNKKILFLN